jgi:hypothetical protein
VANLVIAMVLQEGSVVLQSMGSGGVTQMLKCVATARRRLLPRNEDIVCLVRRLPSPRAARVSRAPLRPCHAPAAWGRGGARGGAGCRVRRRGRASRGLP